MSLRTLDLRKREPQDSLQGFPGMLVQSQNVFWSSRLIDTAQWSVSLTFFEDENKRGENVLSLKSPRDE